MMTFDPGAGEPARWILCFSRQAQRRWMNWFPFIGPYKHVRAFGCVPGINTWIFYDAALDRTSVLVARGETARALMAEWLHGADAIGMDVRTGRACIPRLGTWCVPAVKHLIGLRSGALRPIGLWRDCVRHGGEVIEGARSPARHRSDCRTAQGA